MAFEEIPTEINGMILYYLPSKDKVSLMLTCRANYNLLCWLFGSKMVRKKH